MEAIKIKNYTGFQKELVVLKIKLVAFIYFTGQLFQGAILIKHYVHVLKRLLFFLKKMKHNKFVKIGKRTKINLYVPGFPSLAFFKACSKVLEFEKKMPCISTLISITSACRYKCPHCYQKFDKGKDVDINTLITVIKKLQDKGIAFFNVEGGEPFLVFDRLEKVCNAIDERSEILINSTGDGITYKRLLELKKHKNLLGIMFSLHSKTQEELNQFMGNDNAWENMANGIHLCHEVGIPVTFNTCLLKNDFYNGSFEEIMDVSKNFNGSILQLIKPKPAGGWLKTNIEEFSKEDEEYILGKVDKYNLEKEYKEYPFISPMIREESDSMFGCTAGGTDRFYINAKGDLQPCEFLNISFGNIQDNDFDEIYNKMREVFKEPSSCILCEKYARKIYELKKKNKLLTLPLTPEVSEEIYSNWERKGKVEFYEKLNKM